MKASEFHARLTRLLDENDDGPIIIVGTDGTSTAIIDGIEDLPWHPELDSTGYAIMIGSKLED